MKTRFLQSTSHLEQFAVAGGLAALLAIPGPVASAGLAAGAGPAMGASPFTGAQAQTMRQYQFDLVDGEVELVFFLRQADSEREMVEVVFFGKTSDEQVGAWIVSQFGIKESVRVFTHEPAAEEPGSVVV